MSQKKLTGIIDKDDDQNVLSVVESTDNPGVFGIVALNPDGSDISGGEDTSYVRD